MTIFSIVVSCLIGLVVSGCAANPIGPAIARDDPFTPYQEYISSSIRLNLPPGPNMAPDLMEYSIIGRRDRKSGVVTILAQISIGYIGTFQRKYETARDNRAATLPLTIITRTSSGCMKQPCQYTEHFRVEIAAADLRSAAASGGYSFKVFSRVGNEHIIQVPKELIHTLFASMDRPNAPGSTPSASDRRS